MDTFKKLTIEYNDELDLIGIVNIAKLIFCEDNIDVINKMKEGLKILKSNDSNLFAKLIKDHNDNMTLILKYTTPTIDIQIVDN